MSINLTLVGDICPANINSIFKSENVSTLFGNTLSYIQNADRAICNLECAITDKDTPIAKIGPNLKTSPEAAKVIKKAYTDGCSERDIEMFAHYLRCEAHHDVWDEICKLSWETRKEIRG